MFSFNDCREMFAASSFAAYRAYRSLNVDSSVLWTTFIFQQQIYCKIIPQTVLFHFVYCTVQTYRNVFVYNEDYSQ